MKISNAAKIIVGFRFPENGSGWMALSLHDCQNATIIAPDRKLIILDEGKGRGRHQNFLILFKNVLRFEIIEFAIGHNCVDDPVELDRTLVGERKRLKRGKIFFPVAIRILIKLDGPNLVRAINLGTTATPLLLSRLKEIRWCKIKKADQCVKLADTAVEWVLKANKIIRGKKS